MRHRLTLTLAAMALTAAAAAVVRAAAPDAGAGNDFVLHDSSTAREAHGASTSKIKATRTSAAMKFIVSDKDKGPIKGVVISLTGQTGTTYFTDETDAEGYAEVLVPVGQKYDVAYLSLGRRDIAATVTVTDEPNQNVKLTLRYKRQPPPPPFVLSGVTFDTAKATIRPESFSRLDIVVEFMKYKKRARVEIAGHPDTAGNRKANRILWEKRAQACRDYIVSKGIDRDRMDAVGFGDERPLVPNDTEGGRKKNRRIEAREL